LLIPPVLPNKAEGFSAKEAQSRSEAPNAIFEREDYPRLLKERLIQYGSYVAEVRDSLDANSDTVYSPVEPMMLLWPWFRGRVVVGGDAAHTFPPHLTQGAAWRRKTPTFSPTRCFPATLGWRTVWRNTRWSAMAMRLCFFVCTPVDGG
jgi:hypothetical protein